MAVKLVGECCASLQFTAATVHALCHATVCLGRRQATFWSVIIVWAHPVGACSLTRLWGHWSINVRGERQRDRERERQKEGGEKTRGGERVFAWERELREEKRGAVVACRGWHWSCREEEGKAQGHRWEEEEEKNRKREKKRKRKKMVGWELPTWQVPIGDFQIFFFQKTQIFLKF